MTGSRLLPPLLLVAAVLLSVSAAGNGLLPGDVAAALSVQDALLPRGRGLVEGVNELGRAWPGAIVVTLLVAGVLAWRRCFAEALVVAATLPLRAVNPALKALVDSPRPTGDLVPVLERAEGSGFPSGHATGAVLLYGAVFAVAPALTGSAGAVRLIQIAAASMIVLAGAARVAVGAHWPTDVLGGYLWGGVLLGALLAVARQARRRRGPGAWR